MLCSSTQSVVLNDHLVQTKKYAKKAVALSAVQVSRFYEREKPEREVLVRKRRWYLSSKVKSRMAEFGQEDDSVDPALLALDVVVKRFERNSDALKASSSKNTNVSGSVKTVLLRTGSSNPKYDAWIPVHTNYWCGKDIHVEPYMPFLGDQDQDCELAFEVFEDMADDAGKEIDLSDGEVNRDGNFTMPKDDIDRVDYYSMPESRMREANRIAILAVLDQFEKYDEQMWRILSAALGIKDMRRLKAIARVAEERRREHDSRKLRRKRQREWTKAVEEAMRRPNMEDMPIEEEYSASTTPLVQFCFTCQLFTCPQHANFDVEPVIPIEDPDARERERMLVSRVARSCSKKCFLNGPRPEDREFESEWTAQEILVLREAVPIFGLDPCSLAVVVGSRSCYEVSAKLEDPIEADIAQHEILKARTSKRLETNKKNPDELNGKKAKLSNKSAVDNQESSTIDQDFSPCYHLGPCTQETCSCVKKAMHCEPTCGCYTGRYMEGGKTGGVVWHPSSSASFKRSNARECLNRHYGCDCVTGHCDKASCPCWDQNRACGDMCACDCSVLPQHISVRKRRCRNTPTSISRHKKTYVGKSAVHGFGLFAGERFESGDLVGVYSGQLIDTRLADMIGRLYDATDRTYIFNVTESLVIDGGLMGSKAKFVNHTKPGTGENCASRLVRVRGDAYVALFCKRSVEPGEEFLFDYRFTGEVPQWAKEDRNKKK